ncbi:unnamed protein product, partial [Brassica oleracea var. botrytis]
MCGADPELTGQTVQPHPGLTQGPASDYEYKQLLEGSVYVRLDMPGVSEDNVVGHILLTLLCEALLPAHLHLLWRATSRTVWCASSSIQ